MNYLYLTWQGAAQDLEPHADAALLEPGTGVDADVPRHQRHGQHVQHWRLLLAVPFKNLARTNGGENGNISASNCFLVVLVIVCKITFRADGGSGQSCSLRMAILENSVSVPWDLVLKSMAPLRDNLWPGPAFPPLSFLTKHVLPYSPHLQIRF